MNTWFSCPARQVFLAEPLPVEIERAHAAVG
jgi:hypothetical protein